MPNVLDCAKVLSTSLPSRDMRSASSFSLIALVFIAGGFAGGALCLSLQGPRDEQTNHERDEANHERAIRTRSADYGPDRDEPTDDPPQRGLHTQRLASPSEASPAQPTSTAGVATEQVTEEESAGSWLSESLGRLEEQYQDMRRRTALLEEQVLKFSADPPLVAANDDAASAAAQLPAVAILDVPPAPAIVDPEPDPEPPSVPTPSNIVQASQTLIVNAPVFVPVPLPAGPTPPTPPQTAQRPSRAARVGLSPWAPIDMSLHHNPWATGTLP